jgi:hypothetical protein
MDGCEETMNQKTKLFTIIMVSVAASMLIYFPLTQALESNEELGSEVTIAEIQQGRPWRRAAIKVRLARWFLNHSEPVEIEGAAVYLSENMLIVNTVEDQIRVHLPADWTVGDELVLREELFASGYLSESEDVTIKALGANLIDKGGLRIYLMVCYEIVNASGVHAYANLRVNIED